MKLSKILPLLPIIALLASCSQPEIKVTDGAMLSEKQTQAPENFVVYPDDRPSIPDGKLSWTSPEKGNCASCHGATGSGGSAPALSDPMAMAKQKPVALYKFITYGKNKEHQLQDKLTNREIWNLVFYTRSLATAPLTQAQIDEINPVFGSNCAVCHGTKGDGDGPLARNLEPMPANFQTFRRFYDRTDDTLFDHIANGIKWEGMPNFLGREDRKKNVKFDHAYIKKLVQYVRTFHVSNESTMVADAGSSAATSTSTAPATSTETTTASPEPVKTDPTAHPEVAPGTTELTTPGAESAPSSTTAPSGTENTAPVTNDKANSDKAAPDSKAAPAAEKSGHE